MGILLCAAGYLIIGAVVLGIICAITEVDLVCAELEKTVGLVLIWPVLIVMMFLWVLIASTYWAVSKLMGVAKRRSKNETD